MKITVGSEKTRLRLDDVHHFLMFSYHDETLKLVFHISHELSSGSIRIIYTQRTWNRSEFLEQA